jgi:hypothetical protein
VNIGPAPEEGEDESRLLLRFAAPHDPVMVADWQRHYAAMRELVRDEDQVDVLPGVTVNGMDVGRFAQKNRQHAVWQGLMDGQRELLGAIGITPLPSEPEAEVPATPSTAPVSAFEKGVAALAQYKAREGSVKVPRTHTERLEDGTEVWLGCGS